MFWLRNKKKNLCYTLLIKVLDIFEAFNCFSFVPAATIIQQPTLKINMQNLTNQHKIKYYYQIKLKNIMSKEDIALLAISTLAIIFSKLTY